MSQTIPRPLPALYIPQRQPSDPFEDSFSTGTVQGPSKNAVEDELVTDTSPSPTNRSYFSPDTPRLDLEKGQRGQLHASLSKRIKRSIRIPRTNTLQNDQFDSSQKQKKKLNWILGGLLVILLLLLIGNVIYLDIRMLYLSPTSTHQAQNISLNNNAQESAVLNTPSSSPSGSTSSPTTTDILSKNQQEQGPSDLALTCISKFPALAVTNAPFFCQECKSVLSTVPTNVFPPGTSQADALTKAKVLCQDTVF